MVWTVWTHAFLLIIVINCVLADDLAASNQGFILLNEHALYFTYVQYDVLRWCVCIFNIFDVWYFAKYISFIYHLHTGPYV